MMKLDKYTKGRKNWLGYKQKMQSERVPMQILHQPRGRCDPGRQRRRWLDGLMTERATNSTLADYDDDEL
jgi:hypothetical protein